MGENDAGTLDEWYNSLYSRTVDLISDYAGRELFLIHGESLLLECLSDETLDFSPGFQLLHATYLVEKFLEKLCQRDCNFNVVFFDNHRDLCIPGSASPDDRVKYLLARECIIQHLDQNVSDVYPTLQLKRFESHLSSDFKTYLVASGAYFFMCHDGADTKNEKSRKELREMISWFISSHYNVALINGLEFRDTKIMAMIVESLGRSQPQSLSLPADLTSVASDTSNEDESSSQRVWHQSKDLSQRQCLVLSAIKSLSKSGIDASAPAEAQAMILHLVLLPEIKLFDRGTKQEGKAGSKFIDAFLTAAYALVSSQTWIEDMKKGSTVCDLSDFMDGRLFSAVLEKVMVHGLPTSLATDVSIEFNRLASVVKDTCGLDMGQLPVDNTVPHPKGVPASTSTELVNGDSVLPFSNAVFDAHLAPVRLDSDQSTSTVDVKSSKIFRELSHWHNHKRPVDKKRKPLLTEKEIFRAHRRNQWLQTDIRDYSASLTNAAGGILEPETIIKQSPQQVSSRKAEKKVVPDSKQKPQKGGKKSGPKAAVMSKAEEMKLKNTEKMEVGIKIKEMGKWSTQRQMFDKEADLEARANLARSHLLSLSKDGRKFVQAEALTYALDCFAQVLAGSSSGPDGSSRDYLAVSIFDLARRISKLSDGVSADIASYVGKVIEALGLPRVPIVATSQEKLSFKVAASLKKLEAMKIEESSLQFQLLHTGPIMDRNMDSAPDARTPDFEPDKWQRDVLDQIDAKKSVFVVAPTSAGKTFISFYAMRQILQEDDEGVLVYIAPTKALVNQIAAEVQSRFSKSFGKASKSVWAIHTRDHRINNPTGCQILVTVPHVLQIMLLAPNHANSWSSRVKRIIFDEIHSIGQAEDGVVWEQLLLMAPCPIVALSATVGNTQEFCDWLSLTQTTNGNDMKMIEHPHRYTDLRKYIYKPPSSFTFTGLPAAPTLPRTGLDGTSGAIFFHPVASLLDRSKGLPEDFALEPRDCFTLWQAMKKSQTEDFPLDKSLDPSKALPGIVKKIDVIQWQTRLKEVLGQWMTDLESPFDAVVRELSPPAGIMNQMPSESIAKPQDKTEESNKSNTVSETLSLIQSLHAQNALPALFFNYDRSKCEQIAQGLLAEFAEAETKWKESSSAWKAKIAKWELWKKVQDKAGKKKPVKKTKGGEGDDEGGTRADRAKDQGSTDSDPFASFDPEAPIEGFHVANRSKCQQYEFDEYAKDLRRRDIPEWLIFALNRGIGVHHAGMNRKFRQVCEILFRKGFLRVVIATGTLALGINMPCKTVVFVGDSVFLTALNFRQAAGRAGRRGFDVLGNVVFLGLPYSKICRLVSSRLPDLKGHFPITTSLVLRLFILLHQSNQAKYAVSSINSILSSPRLCLGGPSMKDAVLHHLRFSIEYLQRNQLLSGSGAPLNFAGCVTHLYYTENSSFAFHALLKNGYFHKLSKDIEEKPKQTMLTLMLTLSHIFGQHPVRRSVLESFQARDNPSASVVILPPMPEDASDILRMHNKETLDIYANYVASYAKQHLKGPDTELPLSKIACGGDSSFQDLGISSISPSQPAKITSAFYALSGHRDDFNTISSLCSMVRSGVWLEESVVPYIPVGTDEGALPLNAYLYDFFKHGNVIELEKANGVRSGDVWFVLNDFSLVLATIVTSLENILKVSGEDADMLDVQGGGEAHEEERDDTAYQRGEEEAKRESANAAQAVAAVPIRPKKTKLADSWDDGLSDEGAEDDGKDSEEEFELEAFQNEEGSLVVVLKAFKMLQDDFNLKFRAMWA